MWILTTFWWSNCSRHWLFSSNQMSSWTLLLPHLTKSMSLKPQLNPACACRSYIDNSSSFSKYMRAAIILAGRWAMSLLKTTKDICWINCAWSMYVVYKWRYQLGMTLCIWDNRQQMLVLWAAAFSIGSPWPPSRQPHNVPALAMHCLFVPVPTY